MILEKEEKGNRKKLSFETEKAEYIDVDIVTPSAGDSNNNTTSTIDSSSSSSVSGFYFSLPGDIKGGWNPNYTSDEYVVVFTEGGIGDNICHIPMIKSVRSLHSDSKIIVCPSHFEPFLELPYIDKVFGTPDFNIFDINIYEDIIKRYNCPVYRASSLYGYLEQSTHFDIRPLSDIICDLARVPVFPKEEIQLFLSEKELNRARRIAQSFQPMKNLILIQTETSKYPMDLQGPDKLDPRKRLNLNKDWFPEYWIETIRLIHQNEPATVILHVGLPHEQPLFQDPEMGRQFGYFNCLGKYDLRTIFALLAISDGFINPDSLLNHVGYAVRVKGVVLFGRSNPEIFGHEDFHLNLINSEACSDLFCQRAKGATWDLRLVEGEPLTWTCEHRACMRAITPDIVARALLTALDYNKTNPNEWKG